jgi:hypothetical protein
MSITYSWNIPVVLTQAGLQPQSPASLLTQLTNNVASTNPGYTSDLPGSLIEDVSSTEVAGISLCDQAKVELVNSMTPYGANQFVLGQLGQIYIGEGQPGEPYNTSALVIFTGTIGYVIPNGFVVSDGTYSYQIQGGGVIGGSGSSPALTALAIVPGSWGVPANTVNQILTSYPGSIVLAVNNPNPGTPGGTAESWGSYRQRVLQAGLAASVGTGRYIKTLIGALNGSEQNLIAVQQASGGLRVVVGGLADTYQIANAVYMSVSDVGQLVGSAVSSGRNVTVSLVDPPDTYSVLYVAAVEQTVTMTVTWNTVLTSFTGGGAFPGLTQQPLTDYINSLSIGQVINVLEMNEIFQQAVASVLDPSLLTRLVFAVSINTVVTPPGTGTYAITGDPEGYFFTMPSSISVVQG